MKLGKILSEEYDDGAGGLSGNDDAGQMSAWYVFAAMGLYPVDPVSGDYQLCSPLFDKITIQLPSGKKLEIICRKKTKDAMHIQNIKLNGRAYKKTTISYADIIKCGKFEIELGKNPHH